ncbi:MAG: glycosyltransferase family 1 protein, partial [Dehalococcoidia bacterium]
MSETGLHGRAAILTSVHPPLDVRVFHREARSLAAAGLEVILIAPGAAADPRDGVTFRSLPA